VVVLHASDSVPGCCGERLAGEQTRRLDLDRIHAGNMVHDDAGAPSVLRKAGLPLGLGERGCKVSQLPCAGLKTGGEGLRSVVHSCSWRRKLSAGDLFLISPQRQTVTRRKVKSGQAKKGVEGPPLGLPMNGPTAVLERGKPKHLTPPLRPDVMLTARSFVTGGN
jgi:hypothetical protein